MAIPVFYQGGPYKSEATRVAKARLEQEKKMLWARPLGDVLSGMATTGFKYGLSQIPTGMTEGEKITASSKPGATGHFEKGSPYRKMAEESDVKHEREGKSLQLQMNRLNEEIRGRGLQPFITTGTGTTERLKHAYRGRASAPGGWQGTTFNYSVEEAARTWNLNFRELMNSGAINPKTKTAWALTDLTDTQQREYENNPAGFTVVTKLNDRQLRQRAQKQIQHQTLAHRATRLRVKEGPPPKEGILIESRGGNIAHSDANRALREIFNMSDRQLDQVIRRGTGITRADYDLVKKWVSKGGAYSLLNKAEAKQRVAANAAYNRMFSGRLAPLIAKHLKYGMAPVDPSDVRTPLASKYDTSDAKNVDRVERLLHDTNAAEAFFNKDLEGWFGRAALGGKLVKVRTTTNKRSPRVTALNARDAWTKSGMLRSKYYSKQITKIRAESTALATWVKNNPKDPRGPQFVNEYAKRLLDALKHFRKKKKNANTDASWPWDKGSKEAGGIIPETGSYRLHKGERVVPARGKTVASGDDLTMFSAKIAQKNWPASKKRRVVMQKAIELGYA